MVTTRKVPAAIVAAACEIAALRGLAGVRIDDVARVAGVNKRMIYHYYDHRQGLLDALLRGQIDILLASEGGLDDVAKQVLRTLTQALGMQAPYAQALQVQETQVQAMMVLTQDHSAQAGAQLLNNAAKITLCWLTQQAFNTVSLQPIDPSAWEKFCLALTNLALMDPARRMLPIPSNKPGVVSKRLLRSDRLKPVYRLKSTSRPADS